MTRKQRFYKGEKFSVKSKTSPVQILSGVYSSPVDMTNRIYKHIYGNDSRYEGMAFLYDDYIEVTQTLMGKMHKVRVRFSQMVFDDLHY